MSRRSPNPDRPETSPRVSLGRLFSIFLVGATLACSTATDENVSFIDARQGSGEKTVPALPSQQSYFLIPFSAPDQTDDTTFPYQLKWNVEGQRQTNASKLEHRQSQTTKALLSNPRFKRIQAESLRRSQDAIHVKEALVAYEKDPISFHRFYSSQGHNLLPKQSLSDTLEIKSPFESEEGSSISGIRRASSARTAIYVDSRVNDSVSTSEVEALVQGFDEVSLPRLHALFGTESDIDGNGVINVFMAAPDKIGTDVIGFFRPTDLLPNNTVSGVQSNQMEIVYIRTPGENFDHDLGQATIAHEVFHLINFSVKSLPFFQRTGGFAGVVEELALNEGQAHLAEDLVGWGIGTPALVQLYLNCLSETSLGGGGSSRASPLCEVSAPGNDSLARRGAMMLFLLYMFQQMGGADYSHETAGDVHGGGVDFLRRLTSSGVTGITNLEESTAFRSFFSWYGDFMATLVLDGTNVTSNPRYQFHQEVTDPFTGLLRNVRMHSERSDEYGPILLSGPKISGEKMAEAAVTLDQSLLLTGAEVFRILIPADTETRLRIEGAQSLSLGMAIVRAE